MPLADGDSAGVYDPNTVRDRIRQWQAQGGGVIVADGASTPELDEVIEEEREALRKKQRIRTPSRRKIVNQETPVIERKTPPREVEVEIVCDKSKSAPSKRVVSDEHWRKRMNTLKDRNPSRHSAVGLEKDLEADQLNDLPSRQRRRVSAKDEDAGAKDSAESPSTTRRTSAKMQRHLDRMNRRKSKEHESEKENQANVMEEMWDTVDQITPVKQRYTSNKLGVRGFSATSQRSESRRIVEDEQEDQSRMSQAPFSEGRASHRSRKGNFLTQVLGESKKIFMPQPPEPIAAPRMPSIEQWLDQTPDPFVESQEALQEGASAFSLADDSREAPQEPHLQDSAQDLAASETLAGRSTTRRNRKNRSRQVSASQNESPIYKDKDTEEALINESETLSETLPASTDRKEQSSKRSTPTLGRRGANRRGSSPIKDRRQSKNLNSAHLADEAEKESSSRHTTPDRDTETVAPLRPPGLHIKRQFPSTGDHRLSTIASVATFDTKDEAQPAESTEPKASHAVVPEEANAEEEKDTFDPQSLNRRNSRLARHSDLMSILSQPRAGGRSIRSARSIRTARSRLATATIPDLMNELATDETKYMRELQTLVDGVIPVLLACVLSRADSAVAAGLFSVSAGPNDDPSFTKPIVDMGIALERLKTLHKRLPHQDHRSFMTWAHGAHRVYSEYLKAWRMGFQDVVVNLAHVEPEAKEKSGDESLPRNADGDVVNGDGERVDVAFLLKRPLVRLKYLAKTLKGIDTIQHSTETDMLAGKYQQLVDDARKRADEERSRLEDEAAANIDPTRARDPHTLAPVAGVIIDRNRHVRARDHFNLALQHSNGQRIDCRTELIYRDAPTDVSEPGDVLICEVDGTGRWLLLPPVRADHVSARNGDLQGEIVMMIRGESASGSEWQELMAMQAEEESIGFEWVQMLGLTPVPPSVSRSQSFLSRRRRAIDTASDSSAPAEPVEDASPATKSRTPSPREVDIPIGEQAPDATRAWKHSQTPSSDGELPQEVPPQYESKTTMCDEMGRSNMTPARASQNYVDRVSDLRSLPSQNREPKPKSSLPSQAPRSFKEALGLSGSSNAMGLRRTRAKRISRHGDSSPTSRGSRHGSESPVPSPTSSEVNNAVISTEEVEARPYQPEPHPRRPSCSYHEEISDTTPTKAPALQRSPASLPSRDLPIIPKARNASQTAVLPTEEEGEPVWSSTAQSQLPESPTKLSKRRPGSPKTSKDRQRPKSDGSLAGPQLDLENTPTLDKSHLKPRRSSSPLKHEYEPSTASDSPSDSEASTIAHNDAASDSDTSDEDELEDGDAPTPLLPIGAMKSNPKTNPSWSSRPPTEGSIKPSDSASQAPYKTVPIQPAKSCKTIASIFSWSDTGSWNSLHPDECSIVISPGLIEAFEMSAAHSDTKPLSSSVPVVDIDKFSDMASELTSQNDNVRGERPLVALELTPLVPLRRGTAIDISIRSPPTPNSQITSGNNIMFRSRSAEECEALYALINHARIHNPTYIALQNARGPYGAGSSFPGPSGRRPGSQASTNRSSWFGGFGRSSSYRASTKRASSVAKTESSVGTMSSAFSALKRFSNRNSTFDITKSTIGSRTGSRANSVYTSSDNSSGSGSSTPAPPTFIDPRKEAPIGLSNAKIRLYVRETASKWQDMGSARLTIMRAERNPNVGPDGRPTSSSGSPMLLQEKRIVINGKKGEILLDETLGESYFERVARTGIAVSVWEDVVGPNGEVGIVNAEGGVVGGKATVYMIQMKSEAEAAFTFSLVGRLRY